MQRYYHPLKTHQQHASLGVLVDDIFFQIPQILSLHEAFLTDLGARLSRWDRGKTVGDWFLKSVS